MTTVVALQLVAVGDVDHVLFVHFGKLHCLHVEHVKANEMQ